MTNENENIININIEDEMRSAYIDYSMSVIISRALPDVRDGLKPVHRRVLFGMEELGVHYNKAYKKSARIVGEVLGKYHPHGDSSVYDTMVRMAQDWSLRYPLVDGQGNFGSIDGDSPAAMRYTEARLRRIADEMLTDLNKETVDFQPNFDDSLKEPSVLPAKIPNLLVNGTSGIAVGMATNMAPHNLSEVVDGIVAYIDKRDITISELMQYIKAPDFPTGGIIYGYKGVKSAFETGRGRVVVRAKHHFETSKTGKNQIVFTEIPYMLTKASIIEKAAELVNDKKIEGISDIRDESDRDGLRIVFDLKKDANQNVVLNMLYKFTSLQSAFSVNNVALVNGRPATLNLKDLIVHFVNHRHEVVIRRTKYDLREAQKRAHVLQGLLIALDNLDAVIALIRAAADADIAKEGLITQFNLSEIQAKAILEMRLQRLTGLERQKIQDEYEQIMKQIAYYEETLSNEPLRMQIIKDELADVKARYGDKRRTEIVIADDDISIEDMIADDDMVITVSNQGYIKRTPLAEYRVQSRGGLGSKGVTTKEDDYPEHLLVASMHDTLLIFTALGKLFWLKVYSIPEGSKTSKGRPIQNILNLEKEDSIRSVIDVRNLDDADHINNHYILMCTQQGVVKKTLLEAYSRPRANGIIALNVNEGDKLLNVEMTNGDSEVVIATRKGNAIRFHESKVRPMGRGATGVKGIELEENDCVVGMVCIKDAKAEQLLVLSENGYGKRSALEEYRITNRGGKGVRTLKITEKTGYLVGIKSVTDADDLMIINKSGITIRIAVKNINVIGRATQGVRLIRLNENDAISSIEAFERVEEEPENTDEAAILVAEGEEPTTTDSTNEVAE
jgi:DNA gyrase subunit A